MKSFVRDQTLDRLEKLEKEFESLAKSPTDAEAIHHVRVAIRRLTQCLRLFADCSDADQAAKLHRRTHSLLKRCGKVRNCDISIQLLKTGRVHDPRLKMAIEEERETARRKLAKRVNRLQGEFLWKKWRKRLCVVSCADKDQVTTARRLLPKMVKEWLIAGDAAAKSHAPESLHRFRLLGKRLRYSLELFTGLEEILEPLLEKLRTVQDQLGAINDCATALPVVQGHPTAEAAVTRLLRKREREFRTSWAQERTKGESWKSIFSDTARPSLAPKTNRTKTAS